MDFESRNELLSYFSKLQLGDPLHYKDQVYYIDNIYIYEGLYKGEMEYWLEIEATQGSSTIYLTCDYGSWSLGIRKDFTLSLDHFQALIKGVNINSNGELLTVKERIKTKVVWALKRPVNFQVGDEFIVIDATVKIHSIQNGTYSFEIDIKTREYECFKEQGLSRFEVKKLFTDLANKVDIEAISTPYSEDSEFEGSSKTNKIYTTILFIVAYSFLFLFEDGCERENDCYRQVKQPDGSYRKESVRCTNSRYRRGYYGK